MRWVMRAALLGFALGLAVVLDILRPGGPLLPIGLEEIIPAIFAFPTFAAVLLTINDRQLGQIPWRRVKPVVRALPLWVWIVMGVLFVATLINFGMSIRNGATDPLDFARGFAGNASWINAGAAAGAYGVLRSRVKPVDGVAAPGASSAHDS
jgi:hypothetical protein